MSLSQENAVMVCQVLGNNELYYVQIPGNFHKDTLDYIIIHLLIHKLQLSVLMMKTHKSSIFAKLSKCFKT